MKPAKVMISRPKDKGLEAFKAWMTEVMVGLRGEGGGSSISEERWEEAWAEFWRDKSDKKAK